MLLPILEVVEALKLVRIQRATSLPQRLRDLRLSSMSFNSMNSVSVSTKKRSDYRAMDQSFVQPTA